MAKPRRGKWVNCPEGEIAELGDRLRTRRRRRFLLQSVAGGAVTVLTGGLVFAWLRSSPRGATSASGDFDYAGIRCGRVKEKAGDYVSKALSDAVRDQIRLHLSQCSSCRAHYKAKGIT